MEEGGKVHSRDETSPQKSGAAKKQRVEERIEDTKLEELTCSICFEAGTGVNVIMPEHSCRTCRKDAWRICEVCNESLLSRVCPFCKSDYAALVLYEVPGRRLSDLRSSNLSAIDKKVLMFKVKALESLIPAGNTLLWYPAAKQQKANGSDVEVEQVGTALFSLPRKLGIAENGARTTEKMLAPAPAGNKDDSHFSGDAEDDSDKVFVIVLPMKEDALKLRDYINDEGNSVACFDFVNPTWSMLELSSEGNGRDLAETEVGAQKPANGSAESVAEALEVLNVSAAESTKKVMRLAITESHSRLFLPVPPSAWAEMESAWLAAVQGMQL